MTNTGLIDLGMEGYQFTWERFRGTMEWVEERLDRAFALMIGAIFFIRRKCGVWNQGVKIIFRFF